MLPLKLIPKPIPELISAHDKNQILEYNHAIEQEEGLFPFVSDFSVPEVPQQPVGSSSSSPIEVSDPTYEIEAH
jgi:hypothetical protein